MTGVPHVFATQPAGNVPASYLDDNFAVGGTYTPSGTGAVATTVQSKLRESVSVLDFGAVGDGVTDATAAIQAAITYAYPLGLRIYVPAGIYKITSTLIKPQSFYGLQMEGEGFLNTRFSYPSLSSGNACIQVIGGSGALCGAKIEGIGFDGNSTTFGVEMNGQCGQLAVDCQFGANASGVIFNNSAVGSFTEFCVADRCDFTSNCLQALGYVISSGNNSFHGSGLRNCTINESGSATGPSISIGALCFVYNAPLSFQIWKRTTQAVIAHAGSNESYTHGNITAELFTGSVRISLVSGTVLNILGNLSCFGQFLDLGSARLVSRIQVNPDGTTNYTELHRTLPVVPITTGPNNLVDQQNEQNMIVYVSFNAANYVYSYVLNYCVNGYDGNGFATVLATNQVLNVAGYGPPTFSVSSAQLVATNALWPASGVTANISYLQLGARLQNRMG